MIELKGVRKIYDGVPLLDGVDLVVHDGESMALMGSSGSGKSVLLKIVTGLVKPDEGEVLISGSDVVSAPRRVLDRIREDIGMIFQGSALFDSMSIEENIGFALKNIKEIRPERIPGMVREAMNQVKLGAIETLYPLQLSGGMKKRVGIARAVVARPRLLLADEPTSGLDPATSRAIARLLSSIRRRFRMTCLLVTTSIEIATIVADRVAFLQDGRIAEVTTPEEMANSDNETLRRFASISMRFRKSGNGDE